ncbi:MAG: thiamine pyrophosphate-dependent enzyme [Planctomycetota bacterium]|nr:thiamine pyrophosphate-dependent enzyme [Planctomycetota bacterium]
MAQKVHEIPKSIQNKPHHYCPGCGHGVVLSIIGELVDELGLREKAVGIAPVGCSVFLYEYYDFDSVQAAHGRAPAVATGLVRANPDLHVISYQGDGDLGAIGTAEIIHAANRNENFTTIFINNAIYGMTGGQMAPTTLIGQTSETSPYGRDPLTDGYPVRVCELLNALEGPYYLERTSVTTPAERVKTKNAIKKAFQYQMEGKGFSLVEVLSQCPTNWKMTPVESVKWVNETMKKTFPIGRVRDRGAE